MLILCFGCNAGAQAPVLWAWFASNNANVSLNSPIKLHSELHTASY